MNYAEHPTCDEAACEICAAREREVARKIKPGVERALRNLKPRVEQRRRRPQA